MAACESVADGAIENKVVVVVVVVVVVGSLASCWNER